MNITSIRNTAVQNTNFGCDCKNCNCQSKAPVTAPQADSVELSGAALKPSKGEKVKAAFKKAVAWTKENKNPLKAGLNCAVKGAISGLAVVGAQTVINKALPVGGQIKNTLANKLAVVAALATGVGVAVQNKDAFKKG